MGNLHAGHIAFGYANGQGNMAPLRGGQYFCQPAAIWSNMKTWPTTRVRLDADCENLKQAGVDSAVCTRRVRPCIPDC
jgi:hypothetical protein